MQPHITHTVTVPTGCRARLVAVTAWLGRFPLPIVQLCFRLAIAGVFLKAGLTKMASWEVTV